MVYSIRELENLSGVKAHTIRAWEQRYQLLQPKRTDTNIRYYEDNDLRFLLNVVFLKNNGLKISEIASMDTLEIAEKVKSISLSQSEKETQTSALMLAMLELDEFKFNHILSRSIQRIGFEKTMLDVVHPLLDEISLLWLTGSINPAHENFITYLIRQKLIVALDSLPLPDSSAKSFMVYMPEENTQELSLLFLHFILKSRGFQVIYLGQNISQSDLGAAIQVRKPDFVLGMISEPLKSISLSTYIQQLALAKPDIHWLFTGMQIITSPTSALPKNSSLLMGLQNTLDFISKQ